MSIMILIIACCACLFIGFILGAIGSHKSVTTRYEKILAEQKVKQEAEDAKFREEVRTKLNIIGQGVSILTRYGS